MSHEAIFYFFFVNTKHGSSRLLIHTKNVGLLCPTLQPHQMWIKSHICVYKKKVRQLLLGYKPLTVSVESTECVLVYV